MNMSAVFDKSKAPKGKANAPPMVMKGDGVWTDGCYPKFNRKTERMWFDIDQIEKAPADETFV